jgi:hypothetical protein
MAASFRAAYLGEPQRRPKPGRSSLFRWKLLQDRAQSSRLSLSNCIRRRQAFRPQNVAVIGILLTADFFTHLVGCLLAAAGAVSILVPALWKTPRCFGWLGAALLPALLLTLRYLAQTGITVPQSAGMIEAAWSRLLDPATLEARCLLLPEFFFQGTAEWAVLMAGLVGFWYLGMVLTIPPRSSTAAPISQHRLLVGLLGLAMAVLYFALPNFWGQHGGHILSRVALVPPLLWLACCPTSLIKSRQRVLQGALYLLLAAQLFLVTWHFRDGNRRIQEFTAAVDKIGGGRTIFIGRPSQFTGGVSLTEHGACYYALANGNINLDNYEAELPYFPVRYRPGIVRGRGNLDDYVGRDAVDLVFVWEEESAPNANSDLPLPLVSRCGPLTILANREPEHAETPPAH